MNIDSMVRETLRSHAGDAPTSAGLLVAARSRARRRRVRRTGMVAVVAAGVVALATQISYGASVDGPIVAESATRQPVTLAARSFDLPSFPFTPGWVPDGVPSAPRVLYFSQLERFSSLAVPSGEASFSEGTDGPELPRADLTLSHISPDGRDGLALLVSIHSLDVHPYYRSIAVDQQQLTVLDRPATRYVFDDQSELIVWLHEPGMWVTVSGSGVPPEDVERYANELTDEPVPVSIPFTFDVLPADMDLTWIDYRAMDFADTNEGWLFIGVMPDWGDASDSGETVPASPDDESEPMPETTSIDFNGRQSVLSEGENGSVLLVPLGQDLVLEVRGTLNSDDLLRVAEGMELTPDADVPGVSLSTP